eukprot:jgi/Undpi1/2104/HiC_scaffold_12.g05490.m1
MAIAVIETVLGEVSFGGSSSTVRQDGGATSGVQANFRDGRVYTARRRCVASLSSPSPDRSRGGACVRESVILANSEIAGYHHYFQRCSSLGGAAPPVSAAAAGLRVDIETVLVTLFKLKEAVLEIQRRSGLLYRTGVGFVVCKRARVVALLHLWPEGEAGVKFEMRTGKRVRSEASCKQVRRRSTKWDITGQLQGTNNTVGGAGGGGGGAGAGGGGGGGAAALAPAWFPSLVQQMETRKMETTHNLARVHAKLSRHRRNNDSIIATNTHTRAQHHGYASHHQHQPHPHHQHQHQHQHDSPNVARVGGSCGGHSRGGGSSITSGSTTSSGKGNPPRRPTHGTPSLASIVAPEVSDREDENNESQNDSISSGVSIPRGGGGGRATAAAAAAAKEEDGQFARRDVKGATGGGKRAGVGEKGGGTGGGGGGGVPAMTRGHSSGRMFRGVEQEDGGKKSRPGCDQLSRTAPASMSVGHMHEMNSGTSGAPARWRRGLSVRDMTSTQLLFGAGWMSRLAEISNDIDPSPLVPFSVKLSTIEGFLKGERIKQMKDRKRPEPGILHGGQATIELYSGEARKRFHAEVDRRVRAHVIDNKSNRRGGASGLGPRGFGSTEKMRPDTDPISKTTAKQ